MSGATLSMSQQDIDKVQLVGHFEEKKMFNDSDCINFEKEEEFPSYTPIRWHREKVMWRAGAHWGFTETGRVFYSAEAPVTSAWPDTPDDDLEFEF